MYVVTTCKQSKLYWVTLYSLVKA